MIIRTPSPALRARIITAGENGYPLTVTDMCEDGRSVVRRRGWELGWKLSEPEQRRVAGLLAADDAEPFAAPHHQGNTNMSSKITVNQMLATLVAGGTVTDADIKAAAYGVRNFEITCGPNAWDVCKSRDQLDAYWNALRALVVRLDALTAKPAPTAEQSERVEREFQAAHLEDRAQNAEDREDITLASQLRAQARSIRSAKP